MHIRAPLPLASDGLSMWASYAGIAGGIAALIGLAFVAVQLRQAAAAARTQATIQFQQAFKESRPARDRLQKSFPVHTTVLAELVSACDHAKFKSWTNVSELEKDDLADANAVINALNDVAQYVADGMPLRSALQQYHSIFVRAGALLHPYIERINNDPSNPTRRGVRVIDLYNAGLTYHRRHPKHTGRELSLVRNAVNGTGKAKLVIVDEHLGGLEPRPSYMGVSGRLPWTVRQVLREAQRNLRR